MDSLVWEENCRFLKAYRPSLLKKIENLTADYSDQIKIEYSRRGNLPVFLRKNSEGVFLPIQSKVDPLKESLRIIDTTSFSSTDTLIIYGIGSGIIIDALKDHSCLPQMVIALETDPYIVRALLSVTDLKKIVNYNWLNLLVLPTEEEFFSFLQNNTISIEANKITPVRCQQIMKLNPLSYHLLEKKLAAFRQWAAVNITTQIRAGSIFTENIIANIVHLKDSFLIKDFHNKFQGKTAFIVAGGPSLEKNGFLLKRATGKALIFAVDTAYSYLAEKGIIPDFIVSTDFTKNTAAYFCENSENLPCLLADFEVCPEILDNYKGKKILSGIKDKSILDWIMNRCGDFGVLPKGLSVSHTAFDAAVYMGVKKIIFVGQDLAYSMNRSHVKGASHGVYMEGKSEVWVNGYFGMVSSSPSLKVFLDHYEEMISRMNIDVIDATEGGALIKGSIVSTLKKEIMALSSEPNFNLETELPEFSNRRQYTKSISSALEDLKGLVNSAIIIYRRLILSSAKLLQIIQSADNTSDELKKNLIGYQKDLSSLSETKEINDCLRDMLLEAIMLKAKRTENKEIPIHDFNKKDMIDSLQRDHKYYLLVEEALQSIKIILFREN